VRISLTYETGILTFTYGAVTAAGVERTVAGTSLPEILATGYYTVDDPALRAGDVVILSKDGDYFDSGEAEIHVALDTLVATIPTPDTVITLDAGSTVDDAYNNMVISVYDVSTGHVASRRVIAYVGSTKQVTVDADFGFNIVADDVVRIWADTYSQTATTAVIEDIASAVWEEDRNSHKAVDTMGGLQQRTGSAGRMA